MVFTRLFGHTCRVLIYTVVVCCYIILSFDVFVLPCFCLSKKYYNGGFRSECFPHFEKAKALVFLKRFLCRPFGV